MYHVKGGGAFGYFEVTADVTQWTKQVLSGRLDTVIKTMERNIRLV